MTTLKERQKGCLFGLFIGDALGAPLEFLQTGSFDEINCYSTGGVFSVKKGQWTDDTSMTLCLMDSLIKNGFSLSDQLDHYLRWYENGDYSSIGLCFDIGTSTKDALIKYKETKDPYSGDISCTKSGNGSLMRLAPVPIYFFKNSLSNIINYSKESSKTTHQSPICLDCIGYFSSILVSIFNGERDKLKIIKYSDYTPTDEDVIYLKNDCDYSLLLKYDLDPSGYVIDSLKCALWCFYNTDSFEDAVLKAVNLGGDADTIGAITGQIAGAYYGFQSIPEYYIQNLMKKDYLEHITDTFLSLND